MFGLRNRGQLQTPVLNEFEHLVAGLAGFLLTEHNEDGTHIIPLPSVQLTPIGGMIVWPAATAPDKWRICDGSQLNRVTCKGLYDVIGTTYGVGDGATTFNIPDMRGYTALGKTAAGTGSVLAGTGGSLDHTHTGPSHTHTGPSHVHTGPSHVHTGPSHTHTGPSHDHTFSDTSSDPSDPHVTVDQNEDGITSTAASVGHDHSVSGTTSASGTGNTGAAGTGNTGAAGTDNTGASGTADTGAAGTGATSSANMAFRAVNWIILAGV